MERRQDCFAIAALVAMLVWFCDEIIFLGKIPFFRDLATYFYPLKFSVAEAFKAGEMPLWDSRMAAGFPIVAEFQSAVFYPPSVAFYFLPFFAAIQFTFVFHYAIALLGAYTLFRSWQHRTFVSVIGATLFAFAGTMVSLTNLLNHFQSAVWLPWIIYFWERTLRIRRWKEIVCFSTFALCQLLAGSPEIFLLSIGLVVLDTVRTQWEEKDHSFLLAIAILIGSGFIILGLGMVQLLPTAELILHSRRDQAIPATEALGWSMQPSSLIGLMLPTLEADTSLPIGVRLLLTQGVPFLLSPYIGVISVLGLSCWFSAAQLKERVVFLTLIGGSLLLAFGRYTPVYPFLYDWLPLLRAMRFPEKYYYLTFVLLIFTTVRGLSHMAETAHSRQPLIITSVNLALWILIYTTFRLHPQLLAEVLQPLSSGDGSTAISPATIAAIFVALEKQIAISLILSLLFGLYRLGVLRPTLWQTLLVVTVFFDLSISDKPLHFLRNKNVVKSAGRIINSPPTDRGRLFYYPPAENLHPSFMRVIGTPTYEKATEIAFNNLLPNSGMLYGFEYFQDIDALGRRSYNEFLTDINTLPLNRRAKLLGSVNVKYVVAFHPLEVKGLELLREFPEHYSRLYKVTDAVPRTYIATKIIHDQDPKSTLRRLSSDAFDPQREVIVDTPIRLAANGGFEENAAIKVYRNNRVHIDARLSSPGILVLTDAFYPGWKVRVDGKEQTILRANYLFRGVELPAGNHQVEFSYEPESFKIGSIISLFTAGLLLAVPLIGWFRRRVHVVNNTGDTSKRPITLLPE